MEIWDDEGECCTFYTVKWSDLVGSETDKFFIKYKSHSRFERQIQELAKFLEIAIGNKYGALIDFFRFENVAQALPPAGEYSLGEVVLTCNRFPLRLYCLRISEKLVVLFNGGEKTSWNAQEVIQVWLFRRLVGLLSELKQH